MALGFALLPPIDERLASALGATPGEATPSSVRLRELVVSLPRLGPQGGPDAGMAIAAARAGACGLLDLSLVKCVPSAQQAAERLKRLAAGSTFGLLVHSDQPDVALGAAVTLGVCDTIVVSGGDTELSGGIESEGLTAWIGALRAHARQIGCVVTSADQIAWATRLGADFLIVKGHEAGGVVSEETTFVLLQRFACATNLPIYAWGGVGLHTAAGCLAAGAVGVVLDWQLALTRESPVDRRLRQQIEAMDGSETALVPLPGSKGQSCRLLHQPGFTARDALAAAETAAQFRELIVDRSQASRHEDRAVLLGQDACFASGWADANTPIATALRKLRTAVDGQTTGAVAARALRRNGPLAKSHGTEFPIVQGPMTRVSDVPEFARDIAEGGGLPFLALALMREQEAREMVLRTRELMGDRPWGVGILGFVPRELRDEQIRVIEEARPPFAIVAGGRPDQAATLEAKGMATYLHVPSPGMLDMFVKEGARRFIFEGRECGGHVGPRTSFVLWESMIRTLLRARLSDAEWSRVHVLFAGGVHDGNSAAIVAALAQPLVDRGAKIGVLLGTAYLFTEELVRSGAATSHFQGVTVGASNTVLVETSPGHAIRCAPTEYTDSFEREKQRLRGEGLSHDEVRDRLEADNRGRLRIASKGIVRSSDPSAGGAFVSLDGATQRSDGMYMLGQVAALRSGSTTIPELHASVADGALETLQRLDPQPLPAMVTRPKPQQIDIAIVGMSCFVPGALSLDDFWQNVLDKHDAISTVPADRFEIDRWFDADRTKRDKVYSRWGGFLPDLPFDPLRFGIPPKAMRSVEPMQLIALLLAERALADAGIDKDNPHRERTGVILGVGGGAAELGGHYAFRSMLPKFFTEAPESFLEELPEWTEDSFAGILLNVVAGRVSNRFDLGGINVTVDAACASSLAAIHLACRELTDGAADVIIAGGCDTIQSPFGYLCFSKTGALSPRGRSRTFDESADGIAISEGHAAVVLKRREDAERDGDRIYAVLRGVAGASDGKSKGLAAPRLEGQLRTLRRAYEQAAVSPASVGLFEAHGTGTAVGDQTECQAINQLLTEASAPAGSVAIGGVKSMIGHTKCAAGVIGVIKAALALHHRVLPPTLHVDQPNPKAGLIGGPLYPNTAARPWLASGGPRRAGVSAFGFGGSNFHAVLEEYNGSAAPRPATRKALPAEVLSFRSDTPAKLAKAVRTAALEVAGVGEAGAKLDLADLAFTLHQRCEKSNGDRRATLVVSRDEARNLKALAERLDRLASRIDGADEAKPDRRAFYFTQPTGPQAKVALLFPGQGSQFPNMLRGVAVDFPEVARAFDQADATLRSLHHEPIGPFVFPAPGFSDEDRARSTDELKRTDRAQVALGIANLAMHRLAESFGLRGDVFAGHSYGELVALHAGGVMDERTLLYLSRARGGAMLAAATRGGDAGTMLAVFADGETVRATLGALEGVWIANRNSPSQTVVTGTKAGVAAAKQQLEAGGVTCRPIAVSCAFHSPLVADAREQFARALADAPIHPPTAPVYANATAEPYGSDPNAIRETLAQQLVNEVRFVDQIRRMHEDGARVFVEVGPGRVLSGLVGDTLAGTDHVAVSLGGSDECGVTALLTGLAELTAQGVSLDLGPLYESRDVHTMNVSRLKSEATAELASHVWLVNGAYARPSTDPPRDTRPRHTIVASDTAANAPAPAIETATPPATAYDSPRFNNSHDVTAGAMMFESTPTNPPPALRNGAPTNGVPTNGATTNGATTNGAMSNGAAGPNGHTGGAVTLTRFEASSASGSEDAAFADFQHTMRCFLQTQQAVMEMYYGAPASSWCESAAVPQQVLPDEYEAAAPSNGVAADLGQAFAPPARYQPVAAAPAPAPSPIETAPTTYAAIEPAPVAAPVAATSAEPMARPATTGPSPEKLQEELLEIVSERTGYPTDMLELDANLEADLGIDSIKRVEIIAAFRRSVLPDLAEPPAELMEPLAAATSLEQILQVIGDYLLGASAVAETSVNGGAEDDKLLLALTDIISDQTGREINAIDLNHDLGASPSQRAAIFTELPGRVVANAEVSPAEFARRLDSAKPLSQHLAGVTQVVGSSPRGATPRDPSGPAAAAASAGADAKEGECPRCVAKIIELGSAPRGVDSSPLSGGAVLITQDDRGLAEALAEALLAIDATPVLVPLADLATREAAERAVMRIATEQGRLTGVAHLAPTRQAEAFPAISGAEWDRLGSEELGGLLHLLQAMAPHFKSDDGQPIVMAVTSGGGDFTPAAGEASAPWRGGIAGLLKVAQCEWPEVRFRSFDIDGTADAEALLSEMHAEGPVEVGLRDGRRLGVSVERDDRPVDPTVTGLTLAGDDVVLVTGGGRGITAQVAQELACGGPARFVLLGRSAFPETPEGAETASADDESALRQAVLASMRADGVSVRPAEVQSRVRSILASREIRQTLAAINAAGATAEYHSLDARDADAVAGLVDQVQSRLGPITVVVHGAGVIEDRYLTDKTRESFDRVVGTKIDPLLAITSLVSSGRIDPAKLRSLMLFSSTSGFFGNPGQGDYAAANETLNRIARRLGDAWGVNASALNWGPWSGAGMVKPEVERQFRERGVGMIGVPAGRRVACREAAIDHRDGVRVVLGDGAWIALAESAQHASGSPLVPRRGASVRTPLLASQSVARPSADRIEATVVFDGSSVLLDEHRIDGAPVVPLAVVTEVMAELATHADASLQVVRIENLRQLQGIVLPKAPAEEKRSLLFRGELEDRTDSASRWRMTVIDPNDRGRKMYQATVELRAEATAPPTAPSLVELTETYPLPVEQAYQEWLFHGPAFRLVDSLPGIAADGIDAVVRPSHAGEFTSIDAPWVIDPIALDVGPQLVGFWSRARHDVTLLPSRFAAYERYEPLAGADHSPLECRLRLRPGGSIGEATVDIWYLRDGRVVGRFEGLECVGNRALNRITGVLVS